ncbi:MAG TPA: zf-HC2 domain-containing protein [Caulobacteraceae bacterium]|nr:zf-HC2 domain-containing protein [Caulobacteraceae bacterium]
MTDQVTPLHRQDHEAARTLLPWYVTGGLETAERAMVDAHVGGCAECQAELRFERLLQSEAAALDLDVERGWTSLKARIEAVRGSGRVAKRRRSLVRFARGLAPATDRRSGAVPAPWLGWALAAPLALLLLGLLASQADHRARYVALGAPTASTTPNVVVVFRPQTPERDLRATLAGADARFVGGPTAADAYELRVPPAERATALASLRASREVEMAEPVDAAGPR